jgi:hypothetical protein
VSIHFSRVFRAVAPIISTFLPVAAPVLAGIGRFIPQETEQAFPTPALEVNMAQGPLLASASDSLGEDLGDDYAGDDTGGEYDIEEL